MNGSVAGRGIVVTGASSGIGRALAVELVGAGARVVAAARSRDKLQELAAELGSALIPAAVDISDPAGVADLVAAAGAVDVVVNNAGLGHVEPFLESDVTRWKQTLDTNLIGALLVTRAFLPDMLSAGRGLILNIGSASASGWPYLTLYAASKAALNAASVALDREHAPRGVRITCFEVGPTADTGFGLHSDPRHLPTAARRWTELEIDWRTALNTPATTARSIRAAIEQALSS